MSDAPEVKLQRAKEARTYANDLLNTALAHLGRAQALLVEAKEEQAHADLLWRDLHDVE